MEWQVARDHLLGSEPTHPDQFGEHPEPGLYAWWDPEGVLASYFPDGFPPVYTSVPLYVGIAKTGLRVRGITMHLSTTRVSTVRRSLAALLRDDLGLLPGIRPSARGTKFAIVPEHESALTEWMRAHLRVTLIGRANPGGVEQEIIESLTPPLNDVFAHGGPYWWRMRALRQQLIDDARQTSEF